jgi:hypothetical protein
LTFFGEYYLWSIVQHTGSLCVLPNKPEILDQECERSRIISANAEFITYARVFLFSTVKMFWNLEFDSDFDWFSTHLPDEFSYGTGAFLYGLLQTVAKDVLQEDDHV